MAGLCQRHNGRCWVASLPHLSPGSASLNWGVRGRHKLILKRRRASFAFAEFLKGQAMPRLKVHYDGWIALPAGLRQQLKLNSGDRLDAQLVAGAIVLRPASAKRAPAEPEQAIEPPAVTSAPAPSLETAVPQKRPRGRPRKVQTTERPSELMLAIAGDSLPSPKRKPGRPRKVRLEEAEPAAEPAPSSMVGESTLWKLRPKAELAAKSPDPAPSPPRRPEPSRLAGSHEREERRPFRNVEIRKLGSGRRHNRLQRMMNPAKPG